MGTKCFEDIIPLSDLKINPGKLVNHIAKTHRPALLTSRGRGVAVVQALKDYEEEAEQRVFMQGIVKGLMDLKEGKEVSHKDIKKRLGLK